MSERQPPGPTAEKKDVFVSYSRADESFARDLVDKLASRGKKAWIDLEGIPPTAEWLEEIHRAIEASDAFLFVISPRSAASEMCRAELAHAEKHGKRIVPINLHEVDRAILPAALASRQWITFADGQAFDVSLDTLVRALDTDLPWVRAHTQWLGKAREWEEGNRDRSFLLRGSELRAAEAWLTTPGAAEKEPPATPLQNEYVFASRQAASRRQRGVLAAVVAALLVTAVLAVAAIVQRDRAISERETAVSELLANLSLQRLRTDLDTALLLGVAAYEVKQTPDARNALLVGAQRAEHVQGMVRSLPGATLSAADLSADGRVLATAAGPELAVWDLFEKRLVGSATEAGDIPALALSADGSLLAVARGESPVALYDVTADSLRPRGEAPSVVEGAVSLALSPSEPLLAVGTGDGEIVVYDVETGRRTVHEADRPEEFEGLPMPVLPLAFDETGDRLAAGSPFGVHVVRLGERQRYEGLVPLEGVEALDFVDGAALAVVSQGALFRVDTRTRKPLCGPRLAGLTAVDVAARGGFAVAGRDGLIRTGGDVCRRPSGALSGQQGEIELLRFTRRPGELVSLGTDSLAVRWTPGSSSLAEVRSGRSERMRDVVWGVGEAELVVAGDSGVWLFGPEGAPRRLDGSRTGTAALAAAPEAESIAVAAGDEIRVWRGAEYAAQPPRTLAGRVIREIALASSGNVLAAGTDRGEVHVLDLADGDGVALPVGETGSVSALEFGADDSLLAVGFNTGTLAVWDVEADEPRELLPEPATSGEGRIESLAFAPSGKLLAVGSTDGRVTLWNLDQGVEIPLPARHGGAVTDLTFSPSGEELVSSDDTGVLHVWDVDAERPLGEAFATSAERIEGLDLSPSRELLATVTEYGTLTVVRSALWDPAAAHARACAVAARSVTEREQRLIVSGVDVPDTCQD